MKRDITILTCFVAMAAVSFAIGACTPGEKTAAKTALDVAGDACRFEFGAHPDELPAGVSLADFCKGEEHLQPFLDHLLSARVALSRKLGTYRPVADAGSD